MEDYPILAWYDMVYLFKNMHDIPEHYNVLERWTKDDIFNVIKSITTFPYKYVCAWKTSNNSLLLTYTASLSQNKRKSPPLYIIEF